MNFFKHSVLFTNQISLNTNIFSMEPLMSINTFLVAKYIQQKMLYNVGTNHLIAKLVISNISIQNRMFQSGCFSVSVLAYKPFQRDINF